MPKINKDSLSSPLVISFAYLLLSGLAVMGFRLVFPEEPAPLAYFSFTWRLVRGFLEYLDLFPALALSALVLPFGLKVEAREKNNPFSPRFFLSLKTSIISAIVFSAMYALLFTLALPLARNREADILAQSRLYLLAGEQARESASAEDWTETARFTAICERIWPDNPEISQLRIEAEIRTAAKNLSSVTLPDAEAETWDEAGAEPVNAAEALSMAETALSEERYFDAHWLATLGGRLAGPDSPELAAATRLAGRAWSGINSLSPTARESRAFNLFRLKRQGYEAMLGEEWARAYYIFLELLKELPGDPDAAKYFALSEDGIKRSAFFADEIELTMGKILSGAVFSLPLGQDRLVMRISSLLTSADCAYGIETEIMAFNREGLPLWSMEVPYIKILPFTLDSGPSLAVYLRALDREDETRRWEPLIVDIRESPTHRSEITLPLAWDTFLLLTNTQRGLSGLSTAELKKAAENLGSSGYLPEVFEAELIERFARPLFLLPLGIFAIGIGWQYRSLKRPRYMAILMLGILPLVFNGAVYFIRSFLNRLAILAVVSLGFTTAAICFAAGIVLLLILSLIILASKHG